SGNKGSERKDAEKGPGKDPQPGRSLKNWLRYEKSQFDNMRNGME
ncbi:hypothetical protein MPER_14976, partial [Moniliophthora perniciosa FA553]